MWGGMVINCLQNLVIHAVLKRQSVLLMGISTIIASHISEWKLYFAYKDPFYIVTYLQYRHLVPAPVDRTSASAWLYKTPWITCHKIIKAHQ